MQSKMKNGFKNSFFLSDSHGLLFGDAVDDLGVLEEEVAHLAARLAPVAEHVAPPEVVG